MEITGFPVFPQNLSGAGSGSTSAASEKGNRMRKSNSKNERTLKKEDKKHGHTQCERSGVFPKDEMPLHHTTTAASVQSSWSATGTSDPSTQVNYLLAIFFSHLRM